MYTEEDYEKRGFPFRELLLRFILIVIIVLLLIWLVPKFITPKTNDKKEAASTISEKVFEDNLNKMKEAAINYYTEEKLPREVGQSETMTLDEMIDKKLLSKLTDRNGNKCNGKKSYVKITKTSDEYLLKVNLKIKDREKYILVYLGRYSYCKSYICEKQQTTNNNNTPDVSPIISILPTINDIIKDSHTENKTEELNKNPEEEKKPSKDNINDKVDNNPQNNNQQNNNKPNNNNTNNKPNDNNKPNNNNNNSNNNDKPSKDNNTEKPAEKPNYVYEYKKTTNPTFSNWSNWSSWTKTSCSTQAISCDDSSESCLKKLQRYNRQEQIGTYQKAYAKQKTSIVQTGSYQQKTCSNYNYVIINNKTYATSSNISYKTVNNITSTKQSTTGNWIYIGRYEYTNPPTDTINTHYEFVGANYNNCTNTCTTLPNYYYDKYQLSGTISQVSNTTTHIKTSSSTVSATCSSYTTKTIPIYSSITTYDKAYRTEPLYGTVCYQSTKTRTLKTTGKTSTKWSSYNDKTLLDNGWKYTGNKKQK